jgi:dTDP-4-amino-4,6-dideoxygalactose transaminase
MLEDACHAVGGSFVDAHGAQQRCGNGRFADLSVFSFHPVKHIACGEGGMVTTNSRALHDKLLILRSHGITKDPQRMTQQPGGWYHEMQELGFNYRLSDIHASLGLSQLSRCEGSISRRIEIAQRYDRAFEGTPVRTFPVRAGERHAYHLYVVNVPNRRAVYDRLRERQIGTQVHYIPLHTMPYYRATGADPGPLPHAQTYYAGALSLPMFPALTDDEQRYVIDSVIDAVS